MAERTSRAEYVASVRARMVDLARTMLAGDRPFVEGAVDLYALAREADISKAPEALAKLQPEIERTEAWARELASPVCRSIIERFDA
jgi:hypothetical protein